MADREWGGGQEVGTVYLLSVEDNKRFGSHWFAGRIKDGDVALCVEHTGDCFYDYKLLLVFANGLEIAKDSPGLCGYGLGRRVAGELSAREYHLLMAGEFLRMAETRVKLFQSPWTEEKS